MTTAIPTTKKYRCLFFDLDNTIWNFNLNSYHALKETFHLYGLDQERFEKFYKTYVYHNEKQWELYRQKLITKDELSAKRFELSFGDIGMEGINCVSFNKGYLSQLAKQTRLCDGAAEVLGKLSLKYNLYIITNGFSEVQYKKMAISDLNRYFKRVFVSEEIMSPKPSPEIFRYAMKSCNARKKECLMIGDSWEVDILGAMETGMDQVYYNPHPGPQTAEILKNAVKPGTKTTTYRIISLKQLLNFL